MSCTVRYGAITLLFLTGCTGHHQANESKPPLRELDAAHEPDLLSSESARMAAVPDRYKPLFEPGLGDDEGAALRANLPYSSISLTRSPCFGTCPVYAVTFHRSGKAELDAVEFLPRKGKFTGEVDLTTYGRLCYVIEQSRFKELRSHYSSSWTDQSTCVVTVAEGDRRIEVSDYGAVGPIELWAIQELIDSVRSGIDWKPIP